MYHWIYGVQCIFSLLESKLSDGALSRVGIWGYEFICKSNKLAYGWWMVRFTYLYNGVSIKSCKMAIIIFGWTFFDI
jgi:hypothetical protein